MLLTFETFAPEAVHKDHRRWGGSTEGAEGAVTLRAHVCWFAWYHKGEGGGRTSRHKSIAKCSLRDMRIAGPQRQRRAKVVSQLGHLEITDCGDTLTDDGLSTVVLLRRLKSFEIAFCWNITGDGLIHLCSLANLQSLTVLYCGDRTDRILSRLSQLRNLDLCFMEADEAGFSQVATLHQLQSLEIDVSNIGDEGWSLIRNLEELRSFHAIGFLSDATMCYSMTKLHHLHTLAVTGAVLTDVGLGCLAASFLDYGT